MIYLIACSLPENYQGLILEMKYSISRNLYTFVWLSALYHVLLLYRQHIYWWHLTAAILLVIPPFPFSTICSPEEFFVLSTLSAFGTAFSLIYAWTNMAKERRLLAVHPELFKP